MRTPWDEFTQRHTECALASFAFAPFLRWGVGGAARCMRPTRAAGQRRDQARDRSVAVSVERAPVNVCAWCGRPSRRPTGNDAGLRAWRRSSAQTVRAFAGLGARSKRLSGVPRPEAPGIGRASGGDLSVSLGLPLSSHLAAVEVHGRMVAQRACVFNVLRAALARPATREWAGAVAQSGKIL
jgi:hypothetical protein